MHEATRPGPVPVPVPVNEPLLNGNERKYLLECLDTGWISSEGPFVQRFEKEFAKRMGRKYGIAVANGSVAIDAAVVALGIGPGDEVIIPAFTIISCAAAVVRAGAKPILVDCDPNSWNMDVSQIEAKITSRTRAIMAVHIYGLPVDMQPLLAIAEKHGLKIIEDAAEAHGLNYRDRPCGSFGDLSTFSFYPNKHVTTGEGGMILTDSEELAEKCRSLRNLCFQAKRRFVHEELGWNFRMTNLQAALGLAQLERLDQFISIKRSMGAKYQEQLKDLEGIQLPLASTENAQNCYWVFGMVLNDSIGFDAQEAMRRLAEFKIGTRPFFYPMNLQPVFTKKGWYAGETYPNAEKIAERGFYVPSGLALADSQLQQTVEALRVVVKSGREHR